MKRIFGLILLLVAFNASAIEINRFLSGSWRNANQSGHGFSIEVINEDLTVFYWYVYNPDGSPTFLLTVGENNGNVTKGTTYYNSGMKWGDFNPADRTEIEWGTVEITFHSCDSATVRWDSDLVYEGVPYGSGSIPISRLASIDQLQCGNNPFAGIYRGNFLSQTYDKTIPGIVVLSPDGHFAGISFDAIAGFGTWQENGGGFTGSGIAVSADPNVYFKTNFSVSGVIGAEYRLNGSYNAVGQDNGVVDMYATASLYRRGTSLTEIAGTYSGTNLVTGFPGTATIQSDGSLSGSDNAGCSYDGQLQVPDERFNLLNVTVQVSNCGVGNGIYVGYGIVDDYQQLEDRHRVLLLGTNNTYAAAIDLVR